MRTSVYFKSNYALKPEHPCRTIALEKKQYLTQNGHSRSFESVKWLCC